MNSSRRAAQYTLYVLAISDCIGSAGLWLADWISRKGQHVLLNDVKSKLPEACTHTTINPFVVVVEAGIPARPNLQGPTMQQCLCIEEGEREEMLVGRSRNPLGKLKKLRAEIYIKLAQEPPH
jgi:hypothetical protein